MNTITTSLTTGSSFSDDGKKRYTLRKTWNESKPKLAVIMLAPSEASAISLDNSSMLVLNNALRLGYGTVTILNLFATLNDFSLKLAEDEDAENLEVILADCEAADAVVYAPGVGKASNKRFQVRQEQTLSALRPMEGKLHCLCDKNGESRFQHPLSPAVRTWYLSPMKVPELVQNSKNAENFAQGRAQQPHPTSREGKQKKPAKGKA